MPLTLRRLVIGAVIIGGNGLPMKCLRCLNVVLVRPIAFPSVSKPEKLSLSFV